jgi:hypothetical protein
VYWGHTKVVQLLLDAGAEINSADVQGRTCLYDASYDGHSEAMQLLLASPQLVTKSMSGAAGTAAEQGHAELAVMVLKALMSRDLGAAAIELAGQQSLAAEVLRQCQAIEDAVRQQEARWPALQQLLIGIATAHQQLRAAAVDIPASAVGPAVAIATPVLGLSAGVLAAASAPALADLLSVFLLASPDAAAAAVAAAAAETAPAATEPGAAAPGALTSPTSALHSAAATGNTMAVQQLLAEAQTSVNATDADDCRPLHSAASKGHTAVLQLLLDAGADVNASNGAGATPLHLAAAGSHAGYVQLLLSVPQLSIESLSSAAGAAAAAGHAELAVVVLRALMA